MVCYFLKLFQLHVISRDFVLKVKKSQRVVMHVTSSVLSRILPKTKKSMVIFKYQNF